MATSAKNDREPVSNQADHMAGAPGEPGLPARGPAGLVRVGLDHARAVLRAGDKRALAQRNTAAAFLVRITSAAVAFAFQVVLARWMGGFDYGVFVYVWVWINILGMASTLGLNTVVLRFIPQYRESGDSARLRGLIAGSRLFVFAASTVAAALGAAGIWLFEDAVTSYYVIPFYLALFCFPFYALTDVQEGIARANNWIVLGLTPNFVLRPLMMLALLGAGMLAGYEPTVAAAMLAAVAATWLCALGQLAVLNRRLARVVASGTRVYEPRLWLVTAMPLLLVEGFDMLLAHMDVLMLNYFATPEDVGIYFAALKTMSLVAFISFAVKAGLAHRFAELNAAGDRDGLASFVRDTVNWTFWPSLAAAAGILALGWPLLWLFGPEFTAGYPIMFILVTGFLAKAAVGPVEQVLNMLGHQLATMTVLGTTLALNMVLNLLLIPVLGANGAALATSIALVAEAVMLFHAARRRAGLEVFIWQARSA